MKKPSALLRTLSTKLSARLSPTSVAPWPPARTAFDRWLTSELDDLRIHSSSYATASWLAKSLDAATSAQEMAAGSINSARDVADAKVFDTYLEDTVDLLDACNFVRRRIEEIRTYVDSLAIALHCLEGGQQLSNAALRRTQTALDACAAMEKRCAELDTCGSNLRKLGERLTLQDRKQPESELQEVLTGSRALALLVIGMANVALSFRSRRGVPVVQSSKSCNSWGSSLFELQREAKEEFEKRRKDGVSVMEELKLTILAAQRVRCLVGRMETESGGELRDAMRELKRRCGELEERVKPLEEKVDGLYTGLIDVRMCLLGVISEA